MNTSIEETFRTERPGLPDDELLDLMVSAYRAANLIEVDAITVELVNRLKARRKLH